MSAGNARILPWLTRSRGTCEVIGGGELVPCPETAAPTVRDKRASAGNAGILPMTESHGTREFIGGGEFVPRPQTAAQTHGRRQPFETSV